MASLRNIMNVVEDEHSEPSHTMASNRESASSMSRNTPPNVSRSYQMPPELSMNPTAGAGSYREPSGYSSHPQDPESLHQGNAMASPARSTTESVDYTYAQSPTYAQSQGYSTTGMRQLAPGQNPNDAVPFKLTPVTGRVSRAKKGVPVHICEMCRPPKTFTRAEHLRRHQLSHQPPDLPCPVPGCNKVFHRKDLLDRHQQRHEQDDRLGSSRRCHRDNYTSSMTGYSSSSPSRTMASSHGDPSPSPTTAGGLASHLSSARRPSWSSNTSLSMGSSSPVTSRMQDDQSRFQMNIGPSNYTQGNASLHNSTVPRTYTQGIPPSSSSNSNVDTVQELQVSPIWQTNSNRHIPSTGFPSPSLNSNQQSLATPSLMTWDGNNANALQSLPTGLDTNARMTFNTAGSFGGFVTPRQAVSDAYAGFSHSPSRGEMTQSNDTVRSLPLPLPSGSETPLTPPATLPPEMMMTAPSYVPRPRLSNTPSPTTLRQSVRESIPSYLEVFWSEVGPHFPIIHRATFEAERQLNTDAIDVLCCSLAAVGTQFLDHDDHRTNGSQLHIYVGHKLKQMTQTDHWPLSLMHAILFWEYYSRFRGRDKDSYRGSAIFAAMYQMIANNVPYFLPENSTSTTQKEWIQEESKRRLLSASFILDAHSVRYFEQEPTVINGLDLSNPTTMPLYLISSTTPLWEATEAQWNTLIQHQPLPSTAGWVIEHGLETSHLAASTYFDRCLFLLIQCIQLLPRASATGVNLVPSFSEIDIDRIQIPALFTNTATAHAYMALHYTQLHVVLSVSGDSWVFNKKVLRPSYFTQHQKQLAIWRDSANAVVAVAFAARALRLFLDLDQQTAYQRATAPPDGSARRHKNISDFWGIYVCALICWAFGHTGRNATDLRGSTREAALQWVMQASRMAPTQIMSLAGRSHAQGAIGLAKEVLEKDCLGGRSILLADAVGVLRKLDEGGSCVRF